MEPHTEARKLRLVKGVAQTRPVAAPASALRYRQRIEIYAERVRRAVSVGEIVGILDQALRETRALREGERTREPRQRLLQAEREIESLRADLALARGLLQQDPLTGALNRRGIEAAFARESARAERHGACLCLMVLDLDRFKRLNDTYGHAAGDQALAHLCAVAARALRPSDVFGRIGGEEFVILLPDAHLEDGRQCAMRLQTALAVDPLQWVATPIALTFSAGVAQRAPGEAFELCLRRADAALYAAKRGGRNRVRMAD
jgi:diguanylate cyclase